MGRQLDSVDYVTIPQLTVSFLNGTSQACTDSVCGYKASYFQGDLQCNMQPYLVEGNIWNATKAGVCPERSAFVTRIRAMSVSIGYGPGIQPAFDGRCSFTSEACATQVCKLQYTRVNATGKNNEFMCMSDPAIAAAAVAGTYLVRAGRQLQPAERHLRRLR
ncbi:uncharacterized protein LOC62_02G002702 [Vanrija pseudolonga]|uniref:Uncharacterized protein n=1 Tax=Vanrija pseudolonga TaxID=143232 RepID=A0AAF1BPB4_9TREE|nr:hypothetical protein LOC62_02G002702 [Vanrija pseudolonga]